MEGMLEKNYKKQFTIDFLRRIKLLTIMSNDLRFYSVFRVFFCSGFNFLLLSFMIYFVRMLFFFPYPRVCNLEVNNII